MVDDETPLVSVIIPVFNREEMLRRAVVSVLNQSFKDFECIIVDDCSDQKYDFFSSMDDKRLKIIRLEKRSGVSKARNTGVKSSRGKYIAFLDSDDEWYPKKLEKQIKWLKDNPSFSICQTLEEWIRKGVRVNPPKSHKKRGGDIFDISCERCMITPSSVVMTRELFEKYGGFKESLPACEDYDLWLWITAKHQVGLIEEVLLRRYGGHADQLSSTVPILDQYRVWSLLNLLKNGEVTEEQKIIVKKVIVKKSLILATGCLKRGKINEYEYYKRIAEEFDGC
ncbi:MAG: glycosyltransferase family 2 protein [Chitinispirillaceae bacterium]|nr:glycosyltransferase family 2 protein [Chitinispirillaceae bacterium]